MRGLLGLVLLLLLAAGEAPRTQFRYHPPAQSSWATQGTVAVSTWIGWPGGPEATNEQSEVSWVDLVSESNPGQTILTRTMTRWFRRETGRDEAYPTAFPVGVTERLGLVESDFHLHAPPGRVERMAPQIPMQRSCTPDEVAEAVVWLASPAASYITGTFLDVTGGR